MEAHTTSNANASSRGDDAAAETTTPIRIFISGDRAQVGKSTVCLGLLGALLRNGYAASDIAYIKPATQCEKPQLVTKFCRHNGIACCVTSPIVFYSGFTREFLRGATDSSAQMLANVQTATRDLEKGKRVVVIDGVGYPAVGSICGVSNAAVAHALQAPVVLVGKRGVGDAIDSFNLNAAFFAQSGVKVLGAIFNRLPATGYYSLANCRESILAYFAQPLAADKRVFGFIPELAPIEDDGGEDADESVACDADAAALDAAANRMSVIDAKRAAAAVDAVASHVDVTQLLAVALQHQGAAALETTVRIDVLQTTKRTSEDAASDSSNRTKKSRTEIQEDAWAAGAEGGCRA